MDNALAGTKKNIRARIHQRYRQLGKSLLRASDAEAEALALAISDAHSALGGFCTFCQLPRGCAAEVSYAMLKRWLEKVPQLLVVPGILSKKDIDPEPFSRINAVTLAEVYDVTLEIGLARCGMNPAEASELANCASKSASPAYMFYQRCLAPEKFTLMQHAGFLRTYLDECLPYAAAASVLFFGSFPEAQNARKASGD